jgi:MFS family permease
MLIASTLLFLFANGAAMLFAGRALQGFALGTLSSASAAALVELNGGDFANAALVTAMAVAVAGSLSCIGTGLFAQYLAYPTRLAYVILFVINVPSIVAIALMREPLVHRITTPYRLRVPSVPRLIRRPVVIACAALAVGSALSGIYGSLSPSMTSLLIRGNYLVFSGAILALFNAIGGASLLLARRRAPLSVMRAGVITTLLGAVGIVGALGVHSLAVFFAATLFSGVGVALVFVGSLALVNTLAPPTARAEVVTAYSMSGYVALAIPTVMLGVLANAIGLKSATDVFVLVLVVGGLAALPTLRRRSAPGGASHAVAVGSLAVNAGRKGKHS